MIVDYAILSNVLQSTLTKRYKTNFVSIGDVMSVMSELREPLSKPAAITKHMQQKIKNMSKSELINAIVECFDNITDEWDRDNLTILRALCNEYETKLNCTRYQEKLYFYDKERDEITSISYACNSSLYGCFMHIHADIHHEYATPIMSYIVAIKYEYTKGSKNPTNNSHIVYKNVSSDKEIHDTILSVTKNKHETKREINNILNMSELRLVQEC